MSDRAAIWRAAADLAATGAEGAAMATVCRRRGSLPMATDAKMVVTSEGRRWGTVGGGCTEADVTGQALEAAKAGAPTVVRHTLNADLAGDLGLSCGGTVALFLEPIVANAGDLYAAVAEAIDARVPCTVYTALDWRRGPAKSAVIAGDEIVVSGSGVEPVHARVSSYLSPPLDGQGVADRAPRTAHHSPSEFDEDSGIFIESIARSPRVLIFGAGHVGVEIARLAAGAGFHVIVVDDRADFANPERIPFAHEVIAEDFRTALDRLVLDADDYVLATTRGHSFDAYIVERTAASPARYVGMLGSRRKKEVIWRALEESGVPPASLERVRVPIGEPIGADTPAEIAVSAVAELIKVRRLGK